MSKPIIRFGTDGWRGVIAEEFTFPNVRRVTSAFASYIQESGRSPNVLIGYDRRFHSRAFAECAAKILLARGVNAKICSSPMPTPAVSVSVTEQKADWGIMITASHNPAIYNGFKIKESRGRSAPPEVTEAIERAMDLSTASDQKASPSESADRATVPVFEWRKGYDAYLRSRLDWKVIKSFTGTVVLDHLYGVASGIPENLLAQTSLRTISLHREPDPLFGGLHPEPIEQNLAALKAEVRRARARLGIAFDGDADRLGIVDEKGCYMTPHQVFPLLVLHCIEHKGQRGKIVQAVSLGILGERIAQAYGLPFEEVPVGFKHVAERMLRQDILAGGEESGGFAVKGGLPERDGILSGLLFLEMLAARKQSPSQALAQMEKKFGKARFNRVDIPLQSPIHDRAEFAQRVSNDLPGQLIRSSIDQVRTLDGLKITLKNGAWVLLRPSGTEPLVRTYAESESWPQTGQLLAWAQKTVRRVLETQQVPA